jgi:hypothetical protein
MGNFLEYNPEQDYLLPPTVRMLGDILCLKPRRALDETLLARIREVTPLILGALRTGPAACGSPHCASPLPRLKLRSRKTSLCDSDLSFSASQ